MTKEEAIKLIDDRMCFGRGKWSEHHKPEIDIYWQAGEMAIKALEAEPHWIPCGERLPEDGKQVLVYARGARYALAKYDEMMEADGSYKKQWVTFDAWKPLYTIKEVMAWMPLPEPYKGVTDGND